MQPDPAALAQRKSMIRRSMDAASRAKDRISNIKRSMEGFEVAALVKAAEDQASIAKARSPGRQPRHGQITQMAYTSEPVMELQGRERGGARPVEFQAGPEFEVRVNLEQTITSKAEQLAKLREAATKNEIDLNEKTARRDDLVGMLSEQRQSTEVLEGKIRGEMQDVRGKLEKMNIYKKREHLTQKQTGEKLGHDLKSTKVAVGRLKRELKEVEGHIASTRQDGEELYSKKMEQAQQAWVPMEEAIRTVERQKEKHQEKLTDAETEYARHWNQRQMLHEDMLARERQCEELLLKKKELTIAMNAFKQKHEQELTLFFEELEFQRELARLQHERDVLVRRMDTLEQQKALLHRELYENRNLVREGVGELEALAQREQQFSQQNLVEIRKIEAYMNKQAADHGVAPLQHLIAQVLHERGVSYEEEIIKRQLRLMDDQEMNLLMEMSQREKDAKEQLGRLNDELVGLQEAGPHEDPTALGAAITLKLREMQEAQRSLGEAKQEHEARLRALEEWKKARRRELQDSLKSEEGEGLLGQVLAGAWELDKEIIGEIVKRLVGAVRNEEERSTMESLLNLYSSQVSEREGGLQHILASRGEVEARVKMAHETVQAHQERLETIQTEITAAKADMAGVAVREQAIKKLVGEKQCELEFATMQQGEQNFQKYLKDNSDIFSNVKRTYGAKVAEKMKLDQKKEFTSVNATQLRKRRQKLQEMHEGILAIDATLDRNSLLVNQELSDLSMQTQSRLAAAEGHLAKTQNQMAALTEAEEELVAQLEAVVGRKKDQLVASVQTLFKSRRLDKNERRLAELSQQLDEKQQELENLESSSTDFERAQFDTQANFSIEATNLRTRQAQLKEGLEQISNKVRPGFAQLEKEINGLNFQITGIKKRAQTLHERMHLVKRELEISKSTLVERYGQAALNDLPLIAELVQEDTMQLIVNPEDRKGGARLMASVDHHPTAAHHHEEEVYKSPEEFRPTKVDIQLSEAQGMMAAEEVSRLKEHFGREQLIPTPHTFIHLVRLKYFPTVTLQLDFDDLPPAETALLDTLKPLLGGVEVFRKVLTGSAMSSRKFDPGSSSSSKQQQNPESIGYGFRTLRIVPELTHFEIRKIDKIGHVEHEFPLADFVKQDVHPASRDALRKSSTSPGDEARYLAFNWVFRGNTVDLVVMSDTALRVITKAAAQILKSSKAQLERLGQRVQVLED